MLRRAIIHPGRAANQDEVELGEAGVEEVVVVEEEALVRVEEEMEVVGRLERLPVSGPALALVLLQLESIGRRIIKEERLLISRFLLYTADVDDLG